MLEPPGQHVYYLKVETTSSMRLPATLWSDDAFHSSNGLRQLGLGIFYGIMLAMIVYNFFLFFGTGTEAISTIRIIVSVGSLSGGLRWVAAEYLWLTLPWLPNHSVPVLTSFMRVPGCCSLGHFWEPVGFR